LNSKNKKKEVEFFENKIGLKNSIISGKIYINNWSSAVEAGICTGSGTFSDPYVVKDLIIDGEGTGTGILIEHSKNFYFRIENCTIFNCETGISLTLVNNGTLYRNNCSFNTNGIYLDFPNNPSQEALQYNKNNTILENIANNNTDNGIFLGPHCNDSRIIANTINNNKYGINLWGSHRHNNIIIGNTANKNLRGIYIDCHGNENNYSIISNNILYNNKDYGIVLAGFCYNLTGNIMKGSGLCLGPNNIEAMSYLKIDSSNLVNNKHIYYYINKSNLGQDNFINAGQIYLVNCRNSIISDVDVSYASLGIVLYHSNNITVMNVNSSNNHYGIFLYNTNHSYTMENIITKNYLGVEMGV